MTRHFVVFGLLLLVALPAAGQGTLSTQGLGYYSGQQSSETRATGGALAELDGISPVNPAALPSWGRSGVTFEYAPEFRRVTLPSGAERTALMRFPLTGAALSLGELFFLGLTVSTFLDRTWQTRTLEPKTFSDTTVDVAVVYRSAGAINDIRLAAAWRFSDRLSVGLGTHVLAGSNRLRIESDIGGAIGATPFRSESVVSYSGPALSGGVQWRPASMLAVGLSGRLGGRLRASRNDSGIGRARVPPRVGGTVAFSGLAGATLAANAEWHGWSRLRSLGSDSMSVEDAVELALGAEVKGPRWFGSEIPIRGGIRRQELPFGAGGRRVRETSLSVGAGLTHSGGRANTNLALQRSLRSAGGDVKERAWTVSVGFIVRP